MILLLAGTADGRVIAERLVREGYGVLASAAGEYGGSLLREIPGVLARNGRLGREDMGELLQSRKISALIDATHPFAVEVSEHAAEAAAEAKIAYIRFERKESELPEYPLIRRAPGFSEAAALAVELVTTGSAGLPVAEPTTVFLTTGSKSLSQMVPVLKAAGLEVVARILPDQDSLAAATAAGLSPARIIAAQGPFSADLNRAMFGHWAAEAVIAKDSGSQGGTREKAQAALDLGIPFIMIDRPPGLSGTRPVRDVEALIDRLKAG